MTFDSFIKKYLGKKVDFDGYYEGQCVDLYRQYVEEVLGFPQSASVKGAVNIWDTASDKHYSFIKNTPKAVPDKGDIIIWNKKVGKGFGHVAMFLRGNVKSFVSLDQNWPTLSKVTKTKHSYKNIIGWLHPKRMDTYKGIDLNNKESIKVCVGIWKDVVDGKYIKKGDCDKKIKELKKDFTKTQKSLTELCNNSLKAKEKELIRKFEKQLILEKSKLKDKLTNSYESQLSSLKDNQKKEIKDVLKKAKKDWNVVKLQSQAEDFEKVRNTVAYKIAINVQKILEVLKLLKTGGK